MFLIILKRFFFHQLGSCGKEAACQPLEGYRIQLLSCGFFSGRNLSKRYDKNIPYPPVSGALQFVNVRLCSDANNCGLLNNPVGLEMESIWWPELSKLSECVPLLSRNKICLYEDVLYLADVRWPSSNPVILNSGSRWTESVRDPNTVARDLLSRMVKLLKGILYLTGQERE